jgi:hypothetical protein
MIVSRYVELFAKPGAAAAESIADRATAGGRPQFSLLTAHG